MAKNYISSEQYRQMLVQDGERRFQEWHTQYLNYQKQYLNEMLPPKKIAKTYPNPKISISITDPAPHNGFEESVSAENIRAESISAESVRVVSDTDSDLTLENLENLDLTSIFDSPETAQTSEYSSSTISISPQDNTQLSAPEQIYTFLCETHGAKLSEIEATVELNRVEIINVLRTLIQQGKIRLNEDRQYIAQ